MKVELAWPKRMLSPDLEMSDVRLGLLMTYVASVAIFPRFHPSTLPRLSSSLGRKRHSQGAFKWLLKNALRIIIRKRFGNRIGDNRCPVEVWLPFAPGGEQPGSTEALQPSESPGPSLFPSPPFGSSHRQAAYDVARVNTTLR